MSLRITIHDADGSFNEIQHPRDAKGKFAVSHEGKVSAAPDDKKQKVNAIVTTPTLKEHGFKKLKEAAPGHLATYEHPSGIKVHIHAPPVGQASSSKFTSEKPGHTAKTGVGVELKALLESNAKRGEAVPAVEEDSKVHGFYNNLLDFGFKKEAAVDGHMVFVKKDEGVVVMPNGDWIHSHSGGGISKGNGINSLELHLLSKVDEKKPEAKNKLLATDISPFAETLNAKGYVFSDAEGDHSITFTKSVNNATVQVLKNDAGELSWIAKTPNFLTKYGTTSEQLGQLLSGKPSSQISGVSNSPVKQIPQQVAAPIASANKPWQKGSGNVQAYQGEGAPPYSVLAAAAPEPTQHEISAINAYSGPQYSTINGNLRDGYVSAGISHTVTALDSYLQRSAIPQDVVLFRGVKSIVSDKMVDRGIGSEYVDHGYSSHSTSQNTSISFAGGTSGGALLIVSIPKGATGGAIKAHSHHGVEDEVLFKRGARFRIKSFDADKRHIHVEMVI